MSGATILVTGGAGFIGSHLCDRLVAGGYGVVALDNGRLGSPANVAQLVGHPAFRLVEGDAADPAVLDEICARERIGAVFHLAANSDIASSHADPAIDIRNSLGTTLAVLDAMRRHGVEEMIFASTSAVYGEATGPLREDHGPLIPISHYGAAKLASEAFIASYGENYGIRGWIARFPNVVGARATHGAIVDFVRRLRREPARLRVLGDGTQIKPYLHVDDLLDAVLLAWQRMRGRTNLFNIGGTTRCSVRRMAEIVVEETGTGAAIAYTGGERGWVGDVPVVDYDVGLIQSLGWKPRLDAEAAVRAAARAVLGEHP